MLILLYNKRLKINLINKNIKYQFFLHFINTIKKGEKTNF